ncbi:paraquat-inducible protein A [Roseivirga misakiensis]|uniref:Paraquat-inducible protein A n=1 Tax=Roseivirga misakiensis TaxID=1563681 RepID=A0A1E5SYE8_9BACT|nr:paraquat-inducible protein A [Roseivirga misakiensis]OEK04149.1 hypothetical protein BFP71_11725 [Roseivirga misakiensis]
MNTRNIIAFILIVGSLICLYPGLTEPMLSIRVAAKIPLIGDFELFERTQSVIEVIRDLFKNKNNLVATLILLFSVIIPILKAVLLLVVLAAKKWRYRTHTHKFIAAIGKWSMADVFVVGVLLAYLATSSEESISAEIFEGFYYFTAYCIVSILGIQIMDLRDIKRSISRYNS